jgi:thiopeptide-type bacteriocin biosynthesis protein
MNGVMRDEGHEALGLAADQRPGGARVLPERRRQCVCLWCGRAIRSARAESPGKESPGGWCQVNIALNRRAGAALPSARAVFARLHDWTRTLRRKRELVCCYFVRKPPDIRLRLCLRRPVAALELRDFIDPLVGSNAIRSWAPAAYEPERALFGGEGATRAVHDYFDADTRLWMAHDRLAQKGRLLATGVAASAAIAQDLIERSMDGGEEVWGTWCAIRDFHPPAGGARPSGVTFTPLSLLRQRATAGEAKVLAGYARANQRIARRLRALIARGELRTGKRALLANLVSFHWNRYGFGLETRRAIYATMTEALDPCRPPRGHHHDRKAT